MSGNGTEREQTQRTQLVHRAAERAAKAESAVHRVYAVLAVLGTCVVLGFGIATYLSHLAHADDVARLQAESVQVGARVDVMESRQGQVERRLDWITDALWKSVQGRKAEIEPPPKR